MVNVVKPKPDLNLLFKPRGIAIVGASHTEGKIGHTIVANIVSNGYSGGIYPINPRPGVIVGHKAFQSVEGIQADIDLGIISVPARFVKESIEDCGRAGVKFIVIISSGFGEVGKAALERELVTVAHSYGMRILGPNIFGIVYTPFNLNATFGPADIRPGNVGLISQSGALGIALMGKTIVDKLGLSTIVSLGNKSDLNEEELLEYLDKDPNTKVVLIYMEGTKTGRDLIALARDVVKRTPVVVIKSGSSKRGAKAAASHTGSLAGSDRVFESAFEQAGLLRAHTLEEAFNWVRVFATGAIPKGDRILILTDGGGVGVMATDACERHEVELISDYQYLNDVFGGIVPEFGSTKNPIDLTGQRGDDAYLEALEASLKAEKFDGVIALYCENAQSKVVELSGRIIELLARLDNSKPLTFAFIGGKQTQVALDILHENHVAAYDHPDEAVSSMGALMRWMRMTQKPNQPGIALDFNRERVMDIISNARSQGREQLLETEAKSIFEEIGLSVPKSMLARNFEECLDFSDQIGYPIVIKIASPDIIHKTEAGGIRLDLQTRAEVENAYRTMMSNITARYPKARIDGVVVNELVPKGVETIVGSTTDPSFGPVVMFGLGGIYVEVLKDVVFRVAPINHTEARSMVRSIHTFPLLYGARGEKVKDIEAIADALTRISQLICEVPDIAELDINPMTALDQGKGCKVVDARITLTHKESSTHSHQNCDTLIPKESSNRSHKDNESVSERECDAFVQGYLNSLNLQEEGK